MARIGRSFPARPIARHQARGLVEVALGGNQAAPSGALALKKTLKSLAGDQPSATGALTVQRTLTHITLAGNQPSATGAVAAIKTQFKSLAGNQPAGSGALAFDIVLRHITLAGAQPAGSGSIAAVRAKFISLAGDQPSASGALVGLFKNKLLQGAQAAPSGTVAFKRVLSHISLAGAQPAASGTIAAVSATFVDLAGNQPSAAGALVALFKNKLLQGNQPTATGALAASHLFFRSLAGYHPASQGRLSSSFTALTGFRYQERLEADFSDGWVQSNAGDWEDARGGLGSVVIGEQYRNLPAGVGADVLWWGSGGSPGNWGVAESFFRVDTSRLTPGHALVRATYNPGYVGIYMGQADTIELRAYPAWDGTLAWLAGDAIEISTTLVATMDAQAGGGFVFDVDALAGAINYSGYTNFLICTRSFRVGLSPFFDSIHSFYATDNDFAQTGPRLFLEFTDVLVRGNQPNATGFVRGLFPFITLEGDQPAGSGTALGVAPIRNYTPSPYGGSARATLLPPGASGRVTDVRPAPGTVRTNQPPNRGSGRFTP